uniref:Glycine cleavage T protein (Aminomethyl transferase) n=1 Tax=Polynucleobacter necessarius subsp. necessarius (strain STIR1) TaxID=452638 RepID=B1XUQ3_POLNS
MTQTTQIQQNWLDNPSSLACNLAEWGLIIIEGPDAASFLQNQLTNSVLGLTLTQLGSVAQGFSSTRLVGYCSPKGRLLASAWIGLFSSVDSSHDRYALFISKDIAASTAKRLSMFVLRSKVKVIDLSDSWTVAGVYGPNNQITSSNFNDQSMALRLPDVLVGSNLLARIVMAYPNQDQADTPESREILDAWNELEVLSAIPRIVAATQEQFVPQMINFESVTGVDFKKGCYPGQEIVARSQYRGSIKRRLQLAHVIGNHEDNKLTLPGAELFHSADSGQPAGMVVLSSKAPYDPGRTDLQIECKLEALEDGEIHLGSSSGPVLKIDPLPYPLLEI